MYHYRTKQQTERAVYRVLTIPWGGVTEICRLEAYRTCHTLQASKRNSESTQGGCIAAAFHLQEVSCTAVDGVEAPLRLA